MPDPMNRRQFVSAAAGRWAGHFYGAHNLAVDSEGSVFIGEKTYEGKRVQMHRYRGRRGSRFEGHVEGGEVRNDPRAEPKTLAPSRVSLSSFGNGVLNTELDQGRWYSGACSNR